MLKKKSNAINFGILALALLLAACQQSNDQRPPTEIVEERAQERWDAMVDQDFATAWTFYAPGFRQMTPQDKFGQAMQNRPVRWDAAKVLSVDCGESGEQCTVLTEVSYRAVDGPREVRGIEMTRDLREQWIHMEDQWWYSGN